MFHFPAYPPAKPVPAHDGWRVPPFGNPRIKALSAAPRGLSRPHTSFIGPVRQGIHHTPLPATHAGNTTLQNTRRHIITTIMITKRPNEPRHPVKNIGVRTKSTKQEQTPKKQGACSCSRPLSSSQTTNTHHHTPPAHTRTSHAPWPHRTPHQNQHPGGGGPGTQKHARTTPPRGRPRQTATRLSDLFQTSTPTHAGLSGASWATRRTTTVVLKNSVERR